MNFVVGVFFLIQILLLSYGCGYDRSVNLNSDVSDIPLFGDTGTDIQGDSGRFERHIDYVNVFAGTGGTGFGVGQMIPGPTLPFSLARLSPDTAMRNGAVPFYHCAGYYYEDEYIVGFSHTHLPGVGVPDLGNILFMPITNISDEMMYWTNYSAPLDHKLEKASVGYYSVFLPDRKVNVELTARVRSGLHRYRYEDKSGVVGLVINLDSAAAFGRVEDEEITIDRDKNVIYGYARSMGAFASNYGGLKIYFYAIPDKKIKEYKIFRNGVKIEGSNAKGDNIAVLLSFDSTGDLAIRVGISYVDVDGAKNNVLNEIFDYEFDKYRKLSEDEWGNLLSRFEIKTDNKRDKKIFYTALYHLFQLPTVATDVDGRYRGFDGQIHYADNFVYYTDFSLWDTYRTFHPLMSIGPFYVL